MATNGHPRNGHPRNGHPRNGHPRNGHKKNGTAKNLVVIQLSGGNDYLNTVVSYQDGLY